MLLNSFYSLLEKNNEDGNLTARISFEKSHPIFAGHFPGHPVVPGVCMIQILREVLQVETGRKLMISAGENIKFLSIINPEEHREVEVVLNYTQTDNAFNVNATLLSGPVTFFKFKGTFREL